MNRFLWLSVGGGRAVLWVGSRLCLSTNYDSELRFRFEECYPRYLRIQIFRFALSYWID
jgi:hypothetical protein